MIEQYGIKTGNSQRLIWWKTYADEAYWFDHFRKQLEQPHSVSRIADIEKLLFRHLPKSGRILEAGCGVGWVVSSFANKGYQIEGVDFSEPLIKLVHERFPDLPVEVGNVCQLNRPDNYYQGYISLGVIEHRFEGAEPFLNEAYRIVKPGGTLCISVPHFNLARRLKYRLNQYASTESVPNLEFYQYGYTRSELAKIITNAGFEVKQFEHYGSMRGLQEEFPKVDSTINRLPGLWRIRKSFRYLDATGLLSHMIMVVAQKPL